MTPRDLVQLAILPALRLLPERMNSPAAVAMLIAIALQESGLRHRAQINGPARGWFQFEPIGVAGVQQHHATRDLAAGIDILTRYQPSEVYPAIQHNDVLAAAYARLLLWQWPGPLPGGRLDVDEGWTQYLKLWRPGKPHRERWDANYRAGWEAV